MRAAVARWTEATRMISPMNLPHRSVSSHCIIFSVIARITSASVKRVASARINSNVIPASPIIQHIPIRSMSATAVTQSTCGSKNPLQIYFCASIRGEEVSKPFLNKLIQHLKSNHGPVLTEHIGYDKCEHADQTNRGIYDRDVAWLKASDIVIAECSAASLGVGYELAYAEQHKKPILVLYRWPRADNKHISGMISGCPYEKIVVKYYKDETEANQIMDEWIAEWRKKQTTDSLTALTSMFGLKVPLISAPMAGRSGAALALAVARAGGLGMIAGGAGRDVAGIRKQLAIVAEQQANSPIHLPWGIGFLNFGLDERPEALEAVLAARPLPDAIFFSFGRGDHHAAKARAAGVKRIIAQVQSVDGAIDAAKWADVLCIQGSEAGGHGASAHTRQELYTLVRQAQADGRLPSSIPLVLAGGFGLPESIADGMAQPGVSGLLIGTRFLAAKETEGPVEAKQIAIASSGKDTLRGDVFDLIAMPGMWPAPFDGRAVVHEHASQWLPRLSELRANPSEANEKFKISGPNNTPGLTVWAGTGVDAVTKEETAEEIVEIIGAAIKEGIKRRGQN